MKKSILPSAPIITFANLGFTRDYNTIIGLRGGWFNGITVKHFIGENKALEGILSTRWLGFNITGLYKIHHNAFDVTGLNWYYGGSGHIGFWEGSNVKWSSNNNAYTVIGIDGILGLEYNFDEILINISIDWKPAFNIIGHTSFWGDGAFSIRYII